MSSSRTERLVDINPSFRQPSTHLHRTIDGYSVVNAIHMRGLAQKRMVNLGAVKGRTSPPFRRKEHRNT